MAGFFFRVHRVDSDPIEDEEREENRLKKSFIEDATQRVRERSTGNREKRHGGLRSESLCHYKTLRFDVHKSLAAITGSRTLFFRSCSVRNCDMRQDYCQNQRALMRELKRTCAI